LEEGFTFIQVDSILLKAYIRKKGHKMKKQVLTFLILFLFDQHASAMIKEKDNNSYKNVHMTFHDATIEDLPSLNNLMRSSKETVGKTRYTEEYLDKFMSLLSVTPDVLKVSKVKKLFVEEKLAGFYSFYINDENQLELDNFFLDPAFLYKGYGKTLWSHCLDTAKEYEGRDHFILWSSLEAESFYSKRGCVKIGEKPSPADEKLIQPMLRYNF
jgi:N-acetylglutamate synthase-like GNAT family acetyltransferase